ncbi:MAG: VgrG-related protein, partial [Actinomycetota bacterium]|nr:VgrG-related protein [Actinomycetota bacterium]
MATSAVAASGCVIKVDGSDLPPEQLKSLLEVKVQENVMLPAVATIRMVASDAGSSNPKRAVDQSPFQIGKSLEVQLGSLGERSTKKVFKGEIVSEEPIFEAAHAEVTVRAYDKAHRLNRDRKTRTFQDVTAGDIVSTVAGDHGLSPEVDATSDTFDYVQQSMETDWELLWRLALMYDRELVVDDQKLKFRKGTEAYGTEVTLRYTEGLTAFRPRITGAAEVKKVTVRGWDMKQKQTIVGESESPTLRSDAPASSAHGTAASDGGASGNGTLISDQAPVTVSHATSIATSIMQRLASASIEAEGSAFGLPTLRAGINVKIEGVGTRFSGKYRLSSVTHVWRAAAYTTHFAINGVAARGLLDLVQPKAQPNWGSHLLVGVVTANDDPDGIGRVRVKIPVLSDSDESWWARVLTPSAGASHGIYSLPAVDDEVIIGFENGNTQRPYVL